MAVNVASNLGTRRRRRRGPKAPADAFQRARAVGLRRQGRAPASDTRRQAGRITRNLPSAPRPVASSTVTKPIKLMRAAAKARAGSTSTTTTPPATTTPTTPSSTPTSPKPPKPAVPAGQPKAYGARRKFGTNLPPGLAKRTGSATTTAATPASPRGFTPKPPKRPKRPKGS